MQATPNAMPTHRPLKVPAFIRQAPRHVIAWDGPNVTIMAGPHEWTVDTRQHPEILSYIRRKL